MMTVETQDRKRELLERATFDDECKEFHLTCDYSFRDAWYRNRFRGLTFSEFLCLLGIKELETAVDDLPEFSFEPPNDLEYSCILDEENFKNKDDFMTQVGCVRLFEQKVRDAVKGKISDSELIVWKTLLRVSDKIFQDNIPWMMQRMVYGEPI
ncbi:MAG: hypothetical protein ACO35C_05245 [Pontimonas sp.]